MPPFEDWIKEKLTATDDQIEKAFQIDADTLKRWRLDNNIDSQIFFRVKDTILYPRVAFVEWFMKHMKNKKAVVVPIVPNRTKKDKTIK